MALLVIIGVGYINGGQKSASDTVTPGHTITGRELFNEATEQMYKEAQAAPAPADSRSTASEGQTAGADSRLTASVSGAAEKETAKEAASSTQDSRTEAASDGAKSASAKASADGAKSANTADTETTPGASGRHSILDEPWPPSSAQDYTHVESTFIPRLGSMFLMLCITCTIIWLSLKFTGPFFSRLLGNKASTAGSLNIIERKGLGPGKALILAEVDGHRLLLGLTEQNVNMLADLTPASQPSSPLGSVSATHTQPPDTDIEAVDGDQAESAVNTAKDGNDAPQESGEKKNEPRNLIKEVMRNHLNSLPLPKIHN